MKLSKELVNGFLIFAGIAIFFLAMEIAGLANNFYLRFFNVLFVFYGVNRTVKQNIAEGKNGYLKNMFSAGLTAFIGVILSIISLVAFIHYKGGDAYIANLSEKFLFGGASVNEYSIGLLFEGLASGMIIVFITLQVWRGKTVFK
ncbi:MAG TPA: hypothetical protein PK218_02665 [Flavobacterium sp.]|jgi:hypothetical protein|uniref:hypothetical protein n=1 Tax=Flavobacterium sp. TaxID=239 RepID=UPI002C0EA1C9|nr:hypothetical protein [Flavobacterium sp.]MCA0349521.1 hypothetical protein [Bacteroidota bacterium]HPW97441.1 hypothetical protein [Flavobacterium sp.]HQA73206.1 hypothetical protein [Flavobacterium sp.]